MKQEIQKQFERVFSTLYYPNLILGCLRSGQISSLAVPLSSCIIFIMFGKLRNRVIVILSLRCGSSFLFALNRNLFGTFLFCPALRIILSGCQDVPPAMNKMSSPTEIFRVCTEIIFESLCFILISCLRLLLGNIEIFYALVQF